MFQNALHLDRGPKLFSVGHMLKVILSLSCIGITNGVVTTVIHCAQAKRDVVRVRLRRPGAAAVAAWIFYVLQISTNTKNGAFPIHSILSRLSLCYAL